MSDQLTNLLRSIQLSHAPDTRFFGPPGVCKAKCPGPYPCAAARMAAAVDAVMSYVGAIPDEDLAAGIARDIIDLVTKAVVWDASSEPKARATEGV